MKHLSVFLAWRVVGLVGRTVCGPAALEAKLGPLEVLPSM